MAGILDSIPASLPALEQAQRISERAVAAGFEWESVEDVWAKVAEEVDEFKQATPGSAHAVEEFGDVLFTLVNVARKEGIDAQQALGMACDKFRRRWAIMERLAPEELGIPLQQATTPQLIDLWQQAKAKIARLDGAEAS